MHDSRKVFLLETEPRCVLGIYEAELPGGPKVKRTEYKTWDENIAVGDYVVVPSGTRHDMTVVKIVDVDVEVNLETEAKIDWIVGVVDRSEYERTIGQEAKFLSAARAADKAARKAKLKEEFMANVDASAFALIGHASAEGSDE